MSYFPMFYNFKNRKILVIGGGVIASEKIVKLLYFTNNITIISKEINENIKKLIEQNSLKLIQKEYQQGDLNSFDIVIVATNSSELHKNIYFESRGKVLLNCVDNIKYCDFIFPSFIKKDNLTVAISTSGSSPAFAKAFKSKINSIIPSDIDEFLDKLKTLRETLPKGEKRVKYFEELVNEYLEKRDS